MDLDAHEMTYEDLMASSGSGHFYVDFYQREYKWNDKRPDHKPVISLLNDIWLKFQQAYSPNDIEFCESDVEKYPWYYLSSVLTNTVDGKIYIVDGQQRLTTLTVAVIALLANQNLTTVVKENLEKLIISSTTMAGKQQIRMQLEDRGEVLRSLLNQPSREDIVALLAEYEDNISAKNIIQAYEVCRDFFDEHIEDAIQLAYFCVYLKKRLYLVKIDMMKSEDVAMAFEVINDRGTKLQSYEILKGKLLSLIPKESNKVEITNWDSAVVPLMTLYQKDRSDEFFESFFQARYSRDPEKDRKQLASHNYHQNIFVGPYDEYIGLTWTQDGMTRLQTARNLINQQIPYYSTVFQSLHKTARRQKMDEESNDRFIWFNGKNGLAQNQTQLVMSVLKLGDTLQAEKTTLVSKKLDKLFALSKLTGTYNSSAFSPLCKRLCIVVRESSDKSISEIAQTCDDFILEFIRSAKEKDGSPAKDSPFDYISWNQLSANSLETSFVRYFFARIENYIALEASQTCDSYDKLLSGASYHVEHILSHDEHGENASKFASEDEFEFQRGFFGGIGLLRSSVNCSSNAELYPQKRQTYASESIWLQTLTDDFYKSNPKFKAFMERHDLDFKPYSEFGPAEIRKRTELLAKMTRLIWE
ncbi:MAG: DUF262 domain-containing protein [Adlercreutzia sp.]|nr:DUF262 domain-containing protein [Adlercreutzia sp.]